MNLLKERKVQITLLIIVIFGFMLRLINVNTKKLLGDPPHFAIHAYNFFNSGLLVIWDQSTYLWYAFTSIFYSIFGVSQFATRFPSLLFGTLSIVALYLFVYKFSENKKISIIASVFYAFSPAIIFHSSDEHDISVLFFIILAFFSLISALKNNSKNYLYISAALFGVAAMWKAYVAVLLIPYVGFIWYYHKTKRLHFSEKLKTFLIVVGIILVLVSPTLVYNYINYRHNNVVDFLFATTFSSLNNEKTKALYGWTTANEVNRPGNIFTHLFIDDSNPSDPAFNPPLIVMGLDHSLYANGPIIWPLIAVSFIYLFMKRKKDAFAKDYLVFFSLYFFIPFFVILNGNALNKHHVQFMVFGLPMVAYFLFDLFNSLSEKFSALKKVEADYKIFYVLLGLLILFVFFVLMSRVTDSLGSFYSKNPQNDLIKFKNSNIEKNALIIYDDRIYNSEAGWLFLDRYYIPVSFLTKFLEVNNQSQSKAMTPIYIVECATDDCGLGTVASNKPLNDSMEEFYRSVKAQSIPKVFSVNSKITDLTYYNPLITGNVETPEHFIIYKTNLPVDINLAKQVKMQYEYFLYPTGYLNKESATYKSFIYQPTGLIESSLNKLAWIAFYINILLSLAAILFLLYEIYLHI